MVTANHNTLAIAGLTRGVLFADVRVPAEARNFGLASHTHHWRVCLNVGLLDHRFVYGNQRVSLATGLLKSRPHKMLTLVDFDLFRDTGRGKVLRISVKLNGRHNT